MPGGMFMIRKVIEENPVGRRFFLGDHVVDGRL